MGYHFNPLILVKWNQCDTLNQRGRASHLPTTPNRNASCGDGIMANKALPSPEVLRQLLRYEPDTGKLFWRRRPCEMFASSRDCSLWNARYADREAFTSVSVFGYLRGSIFNQSLFAHRVIWAMQTGAWPCADIDHINRDRACNMWANLRSATRSENHRSRLSRLGSTSRFLGVSWAADRKKWVARISERDGYRHLGGFDDEAEAARAYDRAAKEHHGPFARLNFSETTGGGL